MICCFRILTAPTRRFSFLVGGGDGFQISQDTTRRLRCLPEATSCRASHSVLIARATKERRSDGPGSMDGYVIRRRMPPAIPFLLFHL